MRSIALVLAVLALACAASAAPAGADVFGPISLASAGVVSGAALPEQADYARDPAISGDGLYVVFDGSVGGVQGVWRRDLDSGSVEAVTVCATPSDPHPATCDAELPSISADGRYVSFTTTAPLTAEDTNLGPDVYVRDMSLKEDEASAFALASAVEGSTQGLSYELAPNLEKRLFGSVASGRSALSADGRHVVFVTTAISNLVGPGTPALQVAVRDLDTLTTQLVSVAYDPATGSPALNSSTGLPQPVSASEGEFVYGAVYSPGKPPLSFTTPKPYRLEPQLGASISADGSTVAWTAQDVALQVPTLPEETLQPIYAEPLWRRIADGATAPVRRVTGGGDAANPACSASGEAQPLSPPSLLDPCQGPFRVEAPIFGTFAEPAIDSIPQLSADGSEVAFLANAPTVAEGGDFGSNIANRRSDVYVADMREGLTRAQALDSLTELAGGDQSDIATNAPIVDFGISADGTQVAFATQRTIFPLSVPAYVSVPAATLGLGELFDVDLAQDTLTRVTHGFEGGPAEHPHAQLSAGENPYGILSDGALSPSFSADGDTLAFSSSASNLVYGDGNTPPLGSSRFDGSDAFTVQRVRFNSQPTQQEVSSAPAGPPLVPAWRLDITPVSRRDGSVLLYVQAPGAGRLSARAAGSVAVRAGHGRHVRERVLLRTVSGASATSGADGSGQIALVLAPRYRALAERPGGFTSDATVIFAASGHPGLRASVVVTFVRPRAHRSPARKATRAKARRGGRRRARNGR
jgi:Tol biopolymer transport system component